MRQYHGIKVGDLVRFKHHIFDEFKPVHLVAEVMGTIVTAGSIAPVTKGGIGAETHYVRITDHPQDRHRADTLIVVSRS